MVNKFSRHDISSDEISWIRSRSIKILHLKCAQVTSETAVKIGDIGSRLTWLFIKDKLIEDRSIDKIALGCPNLINWDLSNSKVAYGCQLEELSYIIVLISLPLASQ